MQNIDLVVKIGSMALIQKEDSVMKIVLNPSPMDGAIAAFPLETVDYFFLNQVEACQLLGSENREEPEKQLDALRKRFPAATIVLTLGEKGSLYADQAQKHFQPAFRVKAVDTTAAGDTFTGFLTAGQCPKPWN